MNLNGRLVPGLHANVHGLPQKLECQGIQVLVDGWVAVTYPKHFRFESTAWMCFLWSALTGHNKYQTGTASQPNTDWLGVGSSGYG